MDTVKVSWRTSSYSGANGGNCVEVASPGEAVAVRDTKQDGACRCCSSPWQRGAYSPTR